MPAVSPSVVDDIELQVEGGVARIVLDRPDKRNAMTVPMWRRLSAICHAIDADETIRAVVVSGRGRSFCAGADISALHEDEATTRAVVDEAEAALRNLAVPTIAAVHGHCMGGGLEIAVACDVRIAAHGSSYAVPPAKLAVVYPVAAVEALVWLLGPSVTKNLLFTARTIGHDEAYRIGLVDELVGEDELDTAVTAYLAQLTDKALLTQAAIKALVNTITEAGDSRAEYARWRARWQASADGAEGPRSFIERRPPAYTWHTGLLRAENENPPEHPCDHA